MMIKIFLIMFFLLVINTSYSISYFEIPSIDKMILDSSDIVQVKLVNKKPYEFKKSVFTEYGFKVIKNLKGEMVTGEIFATSLLGGTLGHKQTIVPGATVFFEHEDLILFLKRKENILLLTYENFSKLVKDKDDHYKNLAKKEAYTAQELLSLIEEKK